MKFSGLITTLLFSACFAQNRVAGAGISETTIKPRIREISEEKNLTPDVVANIKLMNN